MEKSFWARLLDAKTEIKAVHKGATNPHFKKNYADLNAIIEEVEPILIKNGLILIQPIIDGVQYTKVVDAFGEDVIESALPLPTGVNPQQLGSAITYFRRYTLQSLLSLRTTDDDANDASGVTTPQQTKAETLPPTPVNASNPLGLGEQLPKADIETFNKMMRLVVSGKRNYHNDIELKYDLNTSQKIQLKNAEEERNAKTN
jgi:hypothetical protein